MDPRRRLSHERQSLQRSHTSSAHVPPLSGQVATAALPCYYFTQISRVVAYVVPKRGPAAGDRDADNFPPKRPPPRAWGGGRSDALTDPRRQSTNRRSPTDDAQ